MATLNQMVREFETVLGQRKAADTNFLKFWRALNELAQERAIEPVNYGEARDLFAQSGLPR